MKKTFKGSQFTLWTLSVKLKKNFFYDLVVVNLFVNPYGLPLTPSASLWTKSKSQLYKSFKKKVLEFKSTNNFLWWVEVKWRKVFQYIDLSSVDLRMKKKKFYNPDSNDSDAKFIYKGLSPFLTRLLLLFYFTVCRHFK